MLTKLTLSVDGRVISRAKRYAQRQGTSVSKLVERMLDAAATTREPTDSATPVLAELRGSLKAGSIKDYRHYLEQKHR